MERGQIKRALGLMPPFVQDQLWCRSAVCAPHWLPRSQEVTVAIPVTWGHDTMDYITPHHPTVEDRLFFRR